MPTTSVTTETTVTFNDGRQETGRVAGSDSDLDIAVIEVDTGEVEPVDLARRTSETPASAARCSPSAIPAAAACA